MTGSRGKWTINAEGKCVPYVAERRDVRAPHVITDEIPGGIRSMADCKVYTSKKKLRDSYRALGKYEIGNDIDWKPTRDPAIERRKDEERRADVERAYYDCRDNNAEMTEEDRARFKRMDELLEKSDATTHND